jgi:hypothetical protein
MAAAAMAPADGYAAREEEAIGFAGLTQDPTAVRLRIAPAPAALAAAAPRLATAASGQPHVEMQFKADPGDHVLARVQRGKLVQWYLPILPRPVHALRAVAPEGGPVTMRFAIPAAMAAPLPPPAGVAAAVAGIADAPPPEHSGGILTFFKFKAIRDLIGGAETKIVEFVAKEIESRIKKDEGFKGFDPQGPHPDQVIPSPELAQMGSRGRMLLLIHGIFSSLDGAFSAIRADAALMQALRAKYPGGIIGYDHWTVARRPQENASMLLSELPPHLDFDVVCHSRGGLVTRAVLELDALRALAQLQTFHNVAFVASANQGSALAVEANWNRLLNIFIGLSSLLGGGEVGVSLSLLVGVLKVLAHGAFSLPSLSDLQPGSGFINSLNAGHLLPIEHASLVHANFDHAQSALLTAASFVVDEVFGGEANDLVVPFPEALLFETAGVPVSIKTIQSYGTDTQGQGSVYHTNFFPQPEVKDILKAL